MSVVKIRNDADDGWIVVGGGVSVVQQAGAPGTTYPGMLWVDTDADNPGNSIIEDDDNDTKIQCEESADEDIIRFDVAGSEAMNIDSAGIVTKPLQPAFHIIASAMTNITTDTTLEFDTEITDQGNNFNTGTYTFTAPVDGFYNLTAAIYMTELDGSYTYWRYWIWTSNDQFVMHMRDPAAEGWGSDPTWTCYTGSINCWMDANDTATVYWQHQGGANQVDMVANNCFFTGFLAC
jgi:hypothetical protein